jgi:hypothetical protein
LSTELILAISGILVSILGSGGAVAWITTRANRQVTEAAAHKTHADTTKLFTDSMKNLISDYRVQTDELQARIVRQDERIKELQDNFELLESHLENTNAMVMKLKLVNSIFVMQLRGAGFEPWIEPSEIESKNIDDLMRIADALTNIDRRRLAKLTEKQEPPND